MTRVPNARDTGVGRNEIVPRAGEHAGAWQFCTHCGERIAFTAPHCPKCGAPTARKTHPEIDVSPKSYGVAVSLCGIFGMMGLHHFYIGRWAHGLFDLGLFLGWIALWILFNITLEPSYAILAGILFVIDAHHTMYVFYRLIIGAQKDGHGRVVTFQR